VDINALDASGRAEGPLTGSLGLQLSGTYSYIGDVIKKLTEDKVTAVAPLYRDGYARLDWNLNKAHHGFLTYSTSTDDLEIITPDVKGGSEELSGDRGAGKTESRFHLGILGLNSALTPSLDNELRVSVIKGYALGSLFGAAEYGANSLGFSFRDELRYTAGEHFTFKPGLDLSAERFDFNYGFATQRGLVEEDGSLDLATLGGYANLEMRPIPQWLIMPGIRYDYYPEVKEGLPSFRISSRYEYRPGMSVKASAGTYSQSPKFSGITAEGLGNPDLPPMQAVQYVAGHEWRITDLLSLDAQGYFNTQSHLPTATDSLDPVTGKDVNYLPDMEARMYGLELMLKQDPGKRFFGWISYSLSRSERRAPGPFAPELYAANGEWDPDAWVLAKNDQTHNLQMVSGWRLPRAWECGLRFQYVTGNPTSPLKSMHGAFSYDSDLRGYVPELGKPFSERVGPFVQLDLRVDKRFVYKSWMLSGYLDLSNVNYFFYNSPEIYGYNYDNSQRKSIGAIFLPSLGLTAEF
jgi:outer membrane receptor protein involved in Fe transport